MPWDIDSVNKHRKGLTLGQKKKWVRIANGFLRRCLAKGRGGCEASAISIANSRFKSKRMR